MLDNYISEKEISYPNFVATGSESSEDLETTQREGCPPCVASGSKPSGDFETQNDACPACSDKYTDRSDEAKKALLTRLKRIEGQVRGLEGMVEKNAYCPDILIQVSAVTSALNSFSKQLLSKHIQGCVKKDIMNGNDESIDELCQLLQRLMK